MATKLNSEFNYRTQVQGETVWEKIKTLKGFLEGRVRAAALEEVSRLKLEALRSEISHCKSIQALPHVILRLQADLVEMESHLPAQSEAFDLNRDEIRILNKLLAEYYSTAEQSRIDGFSDEQMFEANAENEFTVSLAKDIQSEIIANGRPSPAKIRNAMSCQNTFKALQSAGLIPINVKPIDQLLLGDKQ